MDYSGAGNAERALKKEEQILETLQKMKERSLYSFIR